MERRLLKRSIFPVLTVIPVILLLMTCSPFETSVPVAVGNYLYQRGQYQKALLQYLEAKEAKEHVPYVRYNLANTYAALGESEAALHMWEQAEMEADKDLLFKIHYNKGVLLAQLGQYRNAYNMFREAVLLDPGDTAAKKNLELCIRKLEASGTSTRQSSVSAKDAAKPALDEEDKRILNYINRKEETRWLPGSDSEKDLDVMDW